MSSSEVSNRFHSALSIYQVKSGTSLWGRTELNRSDPLPFCHDVGLSTRQMRAHIPLCILELFISQQDILLFPAMVPLENNHFNNSSFDGILCNYVYASWASPKITRGSFVQRFQKTSGISLRHILPPLLLTLCSISSMSNFLCRTTFQPAKNTRFQENGRNKTPVAEHFYHFLIILYNNLLKTDE